MPDEAVPPTLTVEVERNGDTAVVRCHGRLVYDYCEELYRVAKPLLTQTKAVTIDLADLAYVDSMGLGTLVRLYVSSRSAGCQLTLDHLGKQVRNVLSITNLLSVFAQAERHNIPIA